MKRLMYPVPEAAGLVGLGRSKFYELLASGVIDSVKVGRSRLVPHDALVRFVTDLTRLETREVCEIDDANRDSPEPSPVAECPRRITGIIVPTVDLTEPDPADRGAPECSDVE